MKKAVLFGIGAVAVVAAIAAWLTADQEGGEVASTDPAPEVRADPPSEATTSEASPTEATPAENAPASESDPADTERAADASEAPVDADALATSGTGGDVTEPSAPKAPSFDIVRLSPDGAGVIAGRAEPGAEVELLADGEVVARAEASESGEFAIITSQPLESGSRTLTLSATDPDGVVARSADPVIVVAPDVEQSSPVVLRADRAAPELLQRPEVPAELDVTLDAITYGDVGTVSLSGRGSPGRTVRLYLNGAYIGDAVVGADGVWNHNLSDDVAPGPYTLRVDEVDATGKVISRIESPFQRATADAIAVSAGQVVVQPGNSLWRIASRVYGDGQLYTDIFRANTEQIRDPDLIYPGQIFALPESAQQ